MTSNSNKINVVSGDQQALLISVICGIFIYFRKLDYYTTMPRHNLLVSFAIAFWTYVVIVINPWFIVVGLIVINISGKKHKFSSQ